MLLQRVNDVALMTIAASDDFTTTKMQHINACRFFLQVISSSDITTFDGYIINQLAYDGKIEELASPPGRQTNNVLPNLSGTPGENYY
jgi:hypothetical protein